MSRGTLALGYSDRMYEYHAELVRVVDGDTYDLCVDLGFGISFKERFRLKGADTPEVYGSRASEEGREASAFVKALLEAQPGPLQIRTFKDKKGKYGRYLVDIHLTVDADGTSLDTWLSEYLIDQDQATPT